MTAWTDRDYFYCPTVTPFEAANINPASVDLRLGNQLRRTHPIWEHMAYTDMRAMCRGERTMIPHYLGQYLSDDEWEAYNAGGCTIDALPLWGAVETFDTTYLMPREFVLCSSLETVTVPDDCLALLLSKSSTGRLGLEHLHCISGDTLIDVPRDVSKYPGGVPVSELASTSAPFDIYAFDAASMSFVLTRGVAFKARKASKVVRVSYEWMTGCKWQRDSIVCTPDHKFLTLGGEWVQANDLQGKRLRPFARSIDERYPTICTNPLTQRMIREHRFIAQSLHAPTLDDWEVHHLDGNKLNNAPVNIAIVRGGEHQSIHSSGASNPFYGKRHTEETRQRLSEKRKGVCLTEETRRRLSEVLSGERNPRYVPIDFGQIVAAYTEAGTVDRAADLLGVSTDTLVRKIRDNGYSGTVEFRRAVAAQTNHKVYSVVELSELVDTYDIHVPGYENFVANGVVIHNSGLGDPNFQGTWTWELHNVAPKPVKLVAGKRLMQHVFIRLTDKPIRTYADTGRYQGQQGPTPARSER